MCLPPKCLKSLMMHCHTIALATSHWHFNPVDGGALEGCVMCSHVPRKNGS